MAYDLSRLGTARFEHLVQALAITHLGPGIKVFGTGPDGGREATFDGKIDMVGKGVWDGYGVLQAKYKERLTTTAADQAWFFQQLTSELDAWISPTTNRRAKPQYFIMVTNVPLTPVAETGGMDRLEQVFTHYRDLKEERPNGSFKSIGLPGLKDFHVWHAENLERLLETSGDVRRTYADLILPGDVISRLYEQVTESEERSATAWIGHISRTLRTDIAVELGESGDSSNLPLPLAEIAVDLPATFQPRSEAPSQALSLLVERADQVLLPALNPVARDRVVVLGGPGSGKSTISRLLCQLYRVALVRGDSAHGRILPQITAQADHIRSEFDQEGLPTPSLHRLPVRVILSKFADAVTRTTSLTLLQHIVDLINDRGSDPISVTEVKRLITRWPLLIVLDGMDEVASAENRAEVSSRVADFLIDMAAIGADVFTVCTSRPVGFEQDSNIDYEELTLTPLETRDAMHYAARLLACKFSAHPERMDETLERLQLASQAPDTARLMTSPLQVTILSLLLEQRRQAPASRYALFSSYYNTIYARECNKPEGIGDVLERYRSQFDQLHDQCGLAIHARAERAGSAESILPLDDLEIIARDILEVDGYTEAASDALIPQVLRLAQQRLVLLVPRMDGVAFEVRSLAEFFAARHLMASDEAADNLECLVPSAHWRHTWLLAAGLIFSERRNQRDLVLHRLQAADHTNEVNRLVMPGAVLAIEALTDGFAANTPKFEQDLVVAALRLLKGPIGSHITSLADALAPFMDRSTELDSAVWQEIEALLADNSPGSTRAFLAQLATLSDLPSIAVRATNRLQRHVEQGSSSSASNQSTEEQTIAEIGDKLAAAELLIAAPITLKLLKGIAARSTNGSADDETIIETRKLIIEGCQHNYSLRSKLRSSFAAAIEHDHVGYNLRTHS